MESKKKRVETLELLIQQYQASYYNGEAEISDAEFDLLWDELVNLAPDSEVLNKVGTGPDVDGFPKARHLIPMGSQDKASNPQEFLAWAKKMGLEEQNSPDSGKKDASLTIQNDRLTKKTSKLLIVQYKLDGASLELQYEKGSLLRAVTRGDGVIGDEITANALRMKGVVKKMDIDFTGGVRGEVIMTHEVWESKYPSKANCRNAANGLMRRKDGDGCENLEVIVYDASATEDDHFFKDEIEKLKWLEKRGFQITETKTFTTAQEIIAYRDEVAANREKLPFDIDGLVVKDIETDMADLRKARPEKQIAFKFELETAFSVLREVIWSESGATYTPIGVVAPVRLAGTTVKRANLNNPDMIRAMGLKIGSTVSVVKRGEIIPKIEGLAPLGATPGKEEEKNLPRRTRREEHGGHGVREEEEREIEIEIPKVCGTCGADLVDAGTRLYCPNPGCPKRLLHRLEKWVKVLDIRELGEKLIAQLFEKKRVVNISDLYNLKTEELAEYDRMGELSAKKVIRHIQTKRELSLAVFVAGFDLEGIAETTMEKIAAAGFDTLEKLRAAAVVDLTAVYGLGEITASVIVEGIKECAAEMDAVLKTGVISIAESPAAETLPLRGMSFCFTGEMKSMKRTEAEEKIKALGAQAKSSVVKGLSYLVTNDPSSGSSKNKKAQDLGIKIIGEDEFIALVSDAKKPTSPAQGELFID